MLTPSEEQKFDENHNTYPSQNQEPVMKISSIKDLQSVGVLNVPSYEEKSCTIELSDEFSLESQKENGTGAENIEMRESSKKYLNSLVKGKPVYNLYSTPPVSIYDKIEEDQREVHLPVKSKPVEALEDHVHQDDQQLEEEIQWEESDVVEEALTPVKSRTKIWNELSDSQTTKPNGHTEVSKSPIFEEVIEDNWVNEDVIEEPTCPVKSRTKMWNERCDQTTKHNGQNEVSKTPFYDPYIAVCPPKPPSEDQVDFTHQTVHIDAYPLVQSIQSKPRNCIDLSRVPSNNTQLPKTPFYDPYIAVCPPRSPSEDEVDISHQTEYPDGYPLVNSIQSRPRNCIDLSRVPCNNTLFPSSSPDKIKSKSCADVSKMEDPHSSFLDEEFSTLKEKKIVTHFKEDFAKSVPNIQECDDSYFVKNNDKVHSTVLELDELTVKPSVRDLRKLFDQEEPKVKANII